MITQTLVDPGRDLAVDLHFWIIRHDNRGTMD